MSGRDSRHRGRHAGAECGRVRAGSGFGHRTRAGIRPCGAGVRGIRECRVRIFVSQEPVQLDGSGTVRGDARGLPVAAGWRADIGLRGAEGAFQRAEKSRRRWLEVAEAVRGIRQSKGMLLVEGDPDCRSAGSFFKNPSVAPEVAERVKQIAADAGVCGARVSCGGRDGEDFRGVADRAGGLHKGYALGAAGISSRHTLALVNRGGATAAEIVALAEKLRRRSRRGLESGWRWSRRWWGSKPAL